VHLPSLSDYLIPTTLGAKQPVSFLLALAAAWFWVLLGFQFQFAGVVHPQQSRTEAVEADDRN
jgi:hypothetical protein